MEKCDVCAKGISRTSGYILSTTQIITNPRYWNFVFQNVPEQVQVIGKNGERLGSYVLSRATDVTAWHVCETCIEMFSVDKVQASETRKKWSASGKKFVLGTAPFEQALEAAKEGWKLTFGHSRRLIKMMRRFRWLPHYIHLPVERRGNCDVLVSTKKQPDTICSRLWCGYAARILKSFMP